MSQFRSQGRLEERSQKQKIHSFLLSVGIHRNYMTKSRKTKHRQTCHLASQGQNLGILNTQFRSKTKMASEHRMVVSIPQKTIGFLGFDPDRLKTSQELGPFFQPRLKRAPILHIDRLRVGHWKVGSALALQETPTNPASNGV